MFLQSKLFQVRVHSHSNLCEGMIFNYFQCLSIEFLQSTISLMNLSIFCIKCILFLDMKKPENNLIYAPYTYNYTSS